MKVAAPGCLLRRLGRSNRTARAFCCGIPQWLGSVGEQQLERKGHPEKNGMGTAGYMHRRFWNRTGGISSFWDQAQKLTKTTFCSDLQSKMPEWNCVLHERWVNTTGFGTAGELAGDSTPAVICQKADPPPSAKVSLWCFTLWTGRPQYKVMWMFALPDSLLWLLIMQNDQ